MTSAAVCLTVQEIQWWLCHPLTPTQRNRFYGHLATCRECRDKVQEHHEFDRLSRRKVPPAPPRVQGYSIQRYLGPGNCGDAWLASREADARPCVLKFIRRDRLNEEALEELLCWPELAGSPQDPHLVLVSDFLGDSLAARAPIPWEKAVPYIADAAARRELPEMPPLLEPDWCDIHPGNLLLDATGNKVVLDCGLSRFVDDGLFQGWSLGYAAPEALEGTPSERSAVFSLAACLFYLLTGEPPFCPDDRKSYLDSVREGLQSELQLPGLVPLLQQSLAFEEATRPSLKDFGEKLRSLAPKALHREAVKAHSPVNLQVTISVADPHRGDFQPMLSCSSRNPVAALPEVRARTGDLIRIEASSDTDGYLTVLVFNSNCEPELLMPSQRIRDHRLPPGQNRRLTVQLTPPGGIDHTALVWTRRPVWLDAAEWSRRILAGQVAETRLTNPRTRGLEGSGQEQATVGDDWTALVLCVNHQEGEPVP